MRIPRCIWKTVRVQGGYVGGTKVILWKCPLSVRHNIGDLCLMSLWGLGQGFVAFLVTCVSGCSENPKQGLPGSCHALVIHQLHLSIQNNWEWLFICKTTKRNWGLAILENPAKPGSLGKGHQTLFCLSQMNLRDFYDIQKFYEVITA